MTTFSANISDKFDAETDSDCPVVGTEIKANNKTWIIQKVDWISLSDVMNTEKPQPVKSEYDELFTKPHTTRPAVIWLVWVNEKKS